MSGPVLDAEATLKIKPKNTHLSQIPAGSPWRYSSEKFPPGSPRDLSQISLDSPQGPPEAWQLIGAGGGPEDSGPRRMFIICRLGEHMSLDYESHSYFGSFLGSFIGNGCSAFEIIILVQNICRRYLCVLGHLDLGYASPKNPEGSRLAS